MTDSPSGHSPAYTTPYGRSTDEDTDPEQEAEEARRFQLVRGTREEPARVAAEGIEYRDGWVAFVTIERREAIQVAPTIGDVPDFGPAFTVTIGDDGDHSDRDGKLRRWRLNRRADVSGMSGTGYVADGLEFRDGRVAYRWRTTPCTNQQAQHIEDVRHIHGHSNRTTVEWVDSEAEE